MGVNVRKEIEIAGRKVGNGQPALLVAEMSANHNMDYGRAVEIIHRAKEAGADAVKIQTYTADTITVDSDKPWFQITQGTLWDGTTLHRLYEKAYTPWEWQPKLKKKIPAPSPARFSLTSAATPRGWRLYHRAYSTWFRPRGLPG